MRLFRGLAITSLVLAMSLLFAPPALAQNVPQSNVDNEDEGIGVGVAIGLVRNNLSSEVAENFKSKTGTLLGLWIGGNKNGTVGFTGEFLYAKKKVGFGANEATVNALEIPAVFHINVGSHSRNSVGGYGILGPVFTINLNESLKQGVAGDNFNSADIGIIVGAGIEAYRVGFEIRGNWGLKSVTNDNGGVFESNKTRAIEILGKFRFN